MLSAIVASGNGSDRCCCQPPFRQGGQVIAKSEEKYAIECVKAVRKAVGPDVDLLIECHGRFNMWSAIRMAEKLEPFDPFFYEEPIPHDNLDAMAEAYYVAVQPHNSNGPISTIASLHLDTCIPNVIIQEFFYPYLEQYNEFFTEPIKYKDGYLAIPNGPELGTDLNEEAIRKRPPVNLPHEATWMGSYW